MKVMYRKLKLRLEALIIILTAKEFTVKQLKNGEPYRGVRKTREMFNEKNKESDRIATIDTSRYLSEKRCKAGIPNGVFRIN